MGEKIKNVISEIGLEGIWEFEFMVDDKGNLWFLEINFRNSTWSWASTKAGMNLPYLWSECMLDNKKTKNCFKKFLSLDDVWLKNGISLVSFFLDYYSELIPENEKRILHKFLGIRQMTRFSAIRFINHTQSLLLYGIGDR